MISIALVQSLYQPILEAMRDGNRPWSALAGKFSLLETKNIVPLTSKPTVFLIQTDQLDTVIDIEITRTNVSGIAVDPRQNSSFLNIPATTGQLSVPLQLSQGMNFVTVTVRGTNQTASIIVYATNIVTLWEGFARVFYTEADRIITQQRNAIYSNLGTRLFEPYVAFADLLPDVQSLNIIATRLLARGLVHYPGMSNGVNDLISALCLSTPAFRRMGKDTFEVSPALDPWVNSASEYAGQEAHVWIPNVGISSWRAFISYLAAQPDIFDIVDIREDEIALRYQGDLQKHQFDFDAQGADFLTSLARSDCFKSIYVNIIMSSLHIIKLCAASYTFDLFITDTTPIGDGRLHFDSGIPFDSGVPFDSDPVDPFSEGWVGLSLTGRFEQNGTPEHCLDTFVQPSALWSGEQCCYPSFFTQCIANQRADITQSVVATWTGTISDPI